MRQVVNWSLLDSGQLKDFMADLMGIEHVEARAFSAMSQKEPTETLREIHAIFHAEEQRHANALSGT